MPNQKSGKDNTDSNNYCGVSRLNIRFGSHNSLVLPVVLHVCHLLPVKLLYFLAH